MVGPRDFDWPIWGAGPSKSVEGPPLRLLGRLSWMGGWAALGEESWVGSWCCFERNEKKEEVRA